jgi:mRNA interferase RelE/StbE
MNFYLVYDFQPKKFLKKQDKNVSKRILSKLNQVFNRTYVPSDSKSIIGKPNCFRIRIGNYRILYRINYKDKKIIIFKIDKRGKVYGE